MTNQVFENWVAKQDSNAASARKAEDAIMLEQYCEEAHFWLRALVKEIKNTHMDELQAFRLIVREFGLDD